MTTFKHPLLPVDIVFHPSWWNKHAGITFDEDFFYHPIRRVEDERRMEKELYERFGEFGLGADKDKDLPQIGAVHLAAGYLLSEMLGCKIEYFDNSSPQVICPHREDFDIDEEAAFQSPDFKKLLKLIDALKDKYGYICGDINWGGVLNLAIDLKGQNALMDMAMQPEECKKYFNKIGRVVERFFTFIQSQSPTNSISVNRVVRHFEKPVYLHSECTHTMISEEDYLEFLFPIDAEWSQKYRPYGIHYCGPDPHRHASAYGKLPYLDFFDLGWGGDIAEIRKHLPNTFLNIRLNPTELNSYSHPELENIIKDSVAASNNLHLTGICCINMDSETDDEKVRTILRTVEKLRIKS
ncbi:MAG: hypothetical protein LBR68_01350 [Lachnoclostridium sp.]|nr:hypothetical protein [Lachnoclostridium sp.]